MSTKVLSQASAFQPGSVLWITPGLSQSHWTLDLDWYLNFQICKADRHESAELPDAISQIANDTGLHFHKFEGTSNQPLMIASEGLLPNKWVVVLPWKGDMSHWTSKISDIWQNLGEPSFRVFLPPQQTAARFQSEWQSRNAFEDFALVLD